MVDKASALQAFRAYNNYVKTDNNSDDANNGDSFSGLVSDALNAVQDKIKVSEKSSIKAVAKNANITDVVTAVNEAEIALQTIITLRDKVIAAYQDIMKMPI